MIFTVYEENMSSKRSPLMLLSRRGHYQTLEKRSGSIYRYGTPERENIKIALVLDNYISDGKGLRSILNCLDYFAVS